ncbi:MAG: 4Fe-4S binding protein [Bacteroidaceae bacterium]|jgi:ferredoxin
MNKWTENIANQLANGTISMVIGYREGSNPQKTRPFFCTSAEEAAQLILDNRCTNNIAVYLTKKELLKDGRIGVLATLNVLKSALQLMQENQINTEKFLFFTVTPEGELKELPDAESIRQYVSENPLPSNPEVEALLAKIDAMSREERWAYWKECLSKCIKCYACRAACPLCYCTRCIVEDNRPQWILPWASTLPNMEWQINRVMHMAGRCTGCGACYAACPLHLPIHLLTKKLTQEINKEFGPDRPAKGNVLSTFSPDDKENFIH